MVVKKKKPVKKATKKKPVKKKVAKKPVKKTIPKPKVPTIRKTSSVDKQLIQNFVTLQKVLVNLSVKFEHLSTQIEKLLNVFEISAKAITQKGFDPATAKETQDIQRKVDNLLEQNKLIARGLTLMGDRVPPMPAQRPPQPAPRPMPPQPMQAPPIPKQLLPPSQRAPQLPQQPSQPQQKEIQNLEGYEKSLSSQAAPPKEFKKLKDLPKNSQSLKDKL